MLRIAALLAKGRAPRPAAHIATPFLQRLQLQPCSVVELAWEPRVGDVAANGDIGCLTGPGARIVHSDPAAPVTELVYFTVWKRQAGGSFRVFIDQGIATPSAAAFAPAFRRAETARSGDLGVTCGHDDRAPGGEIGHYVRIWSRTRGGAWRVALEVTAATR